MKINIKIETQPHLLTSRALVVRKNIYLYNGRVRESACPPPPPLPQGVGGYSDIFIGRLGPFLGVKKSNFNIFGSFQKKYILFLGYEDFVEDRCLLLIYHHLMSDLCLNCFSIYLQSGAILLLHLRAPPLIYSGHKSVDLKYWLTG